jgi:hypothetical protein
MGAVASATPVVAAGPVLLFGVLAGAAVVTSVAQPGRDAWAYSARHGWVGGRRTDLLTIDAPLAPRAAAPRRLVNACRDAIQQKAERYDLSSLEAVSAGPQTRMNGRTVVPVEIRAIYKVRGVHEVRRTEVRCEVDRAGRVIATS